LIVIKTIQIYLMRKLFFTLLLFLVGIVAFAQMANDSNQKLFTLLSPQQTNVHFNNQLEDTKDHNIMIYSNYYGGAGVGIGDINNDGLDDLFFAGNLVGDKIYLNKGNLTCPHGRCQSRWLVGYLCNERIV